MRQTPRRRRLLLMARLCVGIGFGAAVAWCFFAHLTLHVATGPVGSDGQKLLVAFARSVADTHPRVRLQIVPMADRGSCTRPLRIIILPPNRVKCPQLNPF
jgi:hypothetical protein